MSAHAVTCVEHLIDEYRRFLRSTYRLSDPGLRKQFEQHIDKTDVLVKGPYVTLAQEYAAKTRLKSLVDAGVGHPDLLKLNWPFGGNPIYEHQEKAFRLVDQDKRNCVIKTGTGSGKTEGFLLPALSGVMNDRANGVKGTKAIILYPMNALANDQLERLRKLIKDTGSEITFAMYTGDSEKVAATLGEPLEGNELIQRKQIRDTPPDIILTNYKQLEFMLVRNDDRSLFTSTLRFLVLDEIHSYRGALATEIACLIRRLKSRCCIERGLLRCIGTSATVSEGAGGDSALVRFVSDLFGEDFADGDIVGERVRERRRSNTPYTPRFPSIDARSLLDLDVESPDELLDLAHRITGQAPPQEGSIPQRISRMYEGNCLVELLEDACRQPHSLVELAEAAQSAIPEAGALNPESLRTLIEAYLIVGSVGTDDDPPVLRPKLHTFFHGVYDVGLCMNPDCRLLIRDGSDECPKCHSAVRPAALCRTCGQDFLKVRFPADASKPPVSNDDFRSDENTGFITPTVHVEEAEGEGEEDDNGNGSGGKQPRRRTAARDRLVPKWVCHTCGMVHDDETSACAHCGSTGAVTRQLVLRGKGNTCPVCNSTYTRGDILTLLRSGIASTNSLLATHHLDRLSGEDRKLLVFADNRQEAAHQAGYMNDRHRQFALRHAIQAVVAERGAGGTPLRDLPIYALSQFQDMGLARKRLSSSDRPKWEKTLAFEAAAEFCRSTHQRVSIENLALVEVQYEFLTDLGKEDRFVVACKEAGLKVTNGLDLVRAILDRMRRSRAVDFPFFQEYINPSNERWLLLQREPFSLTIPEHERNPNFFMLDRNERARNSVSGFRFNAIVKNSPRGGAAAIPTMLRRAGVPEEKADRWLRVIVELLQEFEILVRPSHLPGRVRRAIGSAHPLQLSAGAIRLVPADSGYRCQKCQIWKPFRGLACYSTKCSGTFSDLQQVSADPDNYYVRLYTLRAPGRMLALEHTAQIDQEQRAERETAFKNTRLDILVCSPTLELGVDIGPLMTVLLRNAPPTPSNYVQRAGRAGRRLRIGFVSTFCGMGPHDRHCFEDPAWLVRGAFMPPIVRLDNSLIARRHIRSYVLENLEHELPFLMGALVDDLDDPKTLDKSPVEPLLSELKEKREDLVRGALSVFDHDDSAALVSAVVGSMDGDIETVLESWFVLIRRIYEEFELYRTITADRQAKQKAAARERAYRELTSDKTSAYTLNFLSNEGLLPSYQFPTDTFSLDPGVQDTQTLRRPAWIALFEFAPGNLVYANGHKLKSIRAFFEGRNRSGGSTLGGSLEASGRVRPFCFCDACGYASEKVSNDCPQCGTALSDPASIAFIESFEAEENTQISSSEEGRERTYFERQEHLLQTEHTEVEVFPYPFTQIEFCRHAKILVTNWGKRPSFDVQGERFLLCQTCGKHCSGSLSERDRQRWNEDHAKRCDGMVTPYVLGYEFFADALVLPIAQPLFDSEQSAAVARTLGTALVAGAVELLEIEPSEVAFFYHPSRQGGGGGIVKSCVSKPEERILLSLS
jgi:hypothetical protein